MNPLSKCLGVYFGYNKTQCDQLSYEISLGLMAMISTALTKIKAEDGYPCLIP
jgi:hypothetical protein